MPELDQDAALAFAANLLRTLSAQDLPPCTMTARTALRFAARRLDRARAEANHLTEGLDDDLRPYLVAEQHHPAETGE